MEQGGGHDLRELVRQHGGEVYAGGRRAVLPGPGHSRKDRSLSVTLGEGGRLIFHSFANDSVGSVFAYLGIDRSKARESTPAERAAERARREHERRVQERKDLDLCRTIWEGAVPLDGSPAEAYLWSRGLVADGIADITYHPAAPRRKEPDGDEPIPTHPAMVALARDARGAPRGLHLTFIAPGGTGKAFGHRSRLMFGPVAGCAVQLGRPTGGVLAVGEGIETCGAYSTLKGVVCWPCLSSSGLQGFLLPSGVRKLIIAADGDAGGMRAAQALAERAHRICDVEIDPAPEGQDWADVLEAQS